MKEENQVKYWISYPGLDNSGAGYGKGWISPNGAEDPFLVAHLHLIANVATDRAEMHSMIAQQRDNWNKLFQSSLIALAMASTILSALSGYAPNISFSLPACALNAFLAFIMVGFNHFQPSQLAEEQRTAARMCKKLAHDIEFTLKIVPQLRQHAYAFVDEAAERLYAVDKAYPLPLTPMVVEKFPKEVRAPVLSKHVDTRARSEHVTEVGNGWEMGTAQTLMRVSELMVKGDARAYKERAERVKKMNKVCAIAGPFCAGLGAALNLVGVMKGVGLINSTLLHVNTSVLAAMASTLGAFAAVSSHDAQLGMIFELYRSTMGYFEEMHASIERALTLPVNERGNGILLTLQVAYELGHRVEDLATLPSSHKTAGALF